MDLRATKDRHEREDEEADRLVRPSPKLKPPRHDKRREEMQPDRDPDTDSDSDLKGDPDMSMNYKTIGGSVLRRFLAKEPLVTVRLKDRPESRPVQVTEDTLRKEPSKYEVIEKDDGAPKPKAPASPDQPAAATGPASEPNWSDVSRSLQEMASNDDHLKGLFSVVLNPSSDIGGLAKGNPKMSVQPFFENRTPPKEVKTLGDLVKALQAPSPKPTKKKKPPTQPTPTADAGAPEGLPQTKAELEALIQSAVAKAMGKKPPEAPEAKAPAQDPNTSEAPAEGSQAPEDAVPSADTPEDGSEEAPQDEPPRRRVSPEESMLATRLISDTFPPEVASKLLVQELHPDEVRVLATAYTQASARPIDSVEKPDWFQTDPEKVPPPAKVKIDGKLVPFDELDEKQQKRAQRAWAVEVVGRSLAAQTQTRKKLADAMPAKVAGAVSTFMSTLPKDLPRKERMASAREAAEKVFQESLRSTDPQERLSDKQVKDLLATVKDEAAQKLVVAHLQAQDYRLAQEKFLGDHPNAITEHQSAGEIFKGLKEAGKFLKAQAKRYPPGIADRDMSLRFRARVMDRLAGLAPDKYPFVQARLDVHDRDEYDRDIKKHRKAERQFFKQVRKLEKERQGAYNQYAVFSQLDHQDPVPEEPVRPQSVAERMAEAGIKPPLYSVLTKRGQPWREYQDKVAEIEATVAAENREYESNWDEWDEQRLEASKAKKSAEGDYKPPMSLRESLREAGIEEPVPPYKPERYSMVPGEGLEDDFQSRLASGSYSTAHRVARRWVYSFYLLDQSMGQAPNPSDRTAVYWGVEQGQDAPYPGWQQAHARDLSAGDLSAILTAARQWLQTPVLSASMEGVVRDTQLRAALDLAVSTLQDGKYQSTLHPEIYNDLLAKLAGQSESETLLTVAAEDAGSVSKILARVQGGEVVGTVSAFRELTIPQSIYGDSPSEVSMSKASDEIRSYAAKVASEHPGVSYDLMALADRVAGKIPPQFLENAKKKQEEAKDNKDQGDKDQDQGKQQQKEAAVDAYTNLRSLIIRTAHEASPEERKAFAPILQALKG